MHIKTPLAVAITLTLAMGAAAPLQAAGQQAVAATGAVAADAVDLDRIEVRAQLESQIRAVDLKRSSDAIEDAVSSDALGQYPDKNVAESLQRLPGISVTRDQGEGRFIVDAHPAMDRVTVISACSGHGFKHSAAIGEAVAEQISAALRLGPFTLPA